MSNTTIQIKRSSTNAVPGVLRSGELAYSYSSGKLFIGTSDGTSSNAIGGKYFVDLSNTIYGVANAAFTKANNAVTDFSPAYNQANAAYLQANAAFLQANIAYNTANTKVNKSGDTLTGDLTFFTSNTRVGNIQQYDGIDLFADGNASWAQLNFANQNFVWVDAFGSHLSSNSSMIEATPNLVNISAASGINLQSPTTITANLAVATDISMNSLTFNMNAGVVTVPGQVTWNADETTLDVHLNGATLQVGQESLYKVKNQSGATIPNGTVVMASGSLGASGRLLVVPAVANGSTISQRIMGIATENIADGADGFVTHFGKVRGLNTSMFSDGDILWANPAVPGGLINTSPTAPNSKTIVAFVIKAHQSTGTLFVRPTYGSSLGDDEKVHFGTLANNDVLVYVSANNRFENRPSSSLAGDSNTVIAAFNTANAAFANGNTNFTKLQSAFSAANAAFANGNTNFVTTVAAFSTANAAFANGNTNFTTIQSAFSTANSAFANGNTNFATTQAAFGAANSAYANANVTYTAVQSAFSAANASFANGNTTYTTVQAVFSAANAAFLAANSAYNNANSKFSSAGGTIGGSVAITGDLTVSGNIAFVDKQSLRISDPLIYLAGNNYVSDIVDIGFVGNYVNATGFNVHTGFYRSAGTKEYYVFEGYDKEPDQNYINPTGNNFTISVLNAKLRTDNIILSGVNLTSWVAASYTAANSAFANANLTYSTVQAAFGAANAAFANGNTNFSALQVVFGTANAAFTNANVTYTAVQSAYAAANASFANGNTAYTAIQSSFAAANAAFANGNTNFGTLQSTFSAANAAFANANVTYTAVQAAFSAANSSFANGNTNFAVITASFSAANAAFANGNTNFAVLQAAYNKANGAVQTGFTSLTANGNTITAATNNSTFTIFAGSGIGISANSGNNGITITSTATGGDPGPAFNAANAAFLAANSSFSNGNTNFVTTVAAFNKANSALQNTTGVFSGTLTATGDVRGFALASTQSVGSEGGQIDLATAQGANTVLLGGNVSIDIYGNKLRFFEAGGTNRGAFIDISLATAGVGSDLLSGAGGSDTVARAAASAAFGAANAAFANGNTNFTTLQSAFGAANAAFANANSTHTFAVSVSSTANAAFSNGNTNFGTTQASFAAANASFANGNTNFGTTVAAYNKANGAAQLAFGTIVANGNTITAASNASTFRIFAGTNMAVTTEGSNITLTSTATGGGGGTANIAILDEGVYFTNSVSSINFTGAGVSLSNTGNNVTVTIPGGGGGGAPTTNVITANTVTAVKDNRYFLTNTSFTTVTLPAAPSVGDTVYIVVTNGLSNNVVARNGSRIMSLTEDLTLDIIYYSIGLTYVTANLGWVII